MANPQHVARLLNGVHDWNEWRTGLDPCGLILQEVELDDADVGHADLSGADLRRANLNGADLSSTDLRGTDLRKANLDGAYLNWAKLLYTRLDGANLRGANLMRAAFSSVNLQGADLEKAILGETVFADVNFEQTSGLETCEHVMASFLDYRTLAQSSPLPLCFLRGCGLPDEFINLLPSLLDQSNRLQSCFISYSTQDQAFADRLYGDLQNKGVRCWFAPHDAHGGKKLHEQIDDAVHMYDRLVLILSEASMNSEWVKTEISHARQKELNERRQVLFPIGLVAFARVRDWKCFDADTGKDSAREIREYLIPDFSNWKNHESYREAFQRLLNGLTSPSKRVAGHT